MVKGKWVVLAGIGILLLLAIPEFFYKNKGNSQSIGSVAKGRLENAYLMPYSGANFSYFSPLSYYILNNGYTNSRVYKTIIDAYKVCEKSCEGIHFKIMECSNKKGGKMLIHRTHQNGLSVDFMIPKKKGKQQSTFFDKIGLWHYLLEFTDSGILKINENVQIDFETMGKHILALKKAAQKNGLRIKKVIFKIELKDDFFKTKSGRQVKQKGIYFARSLPDLVNRVHDDHYHIDFELMK